MDFGEFIMKRIRESGGRVSVSSDAHQPDALDFAFDKALDYCRKCGFDSVYHLTANGIIEEKI
jgi:histidinol phosphatase-like PHP family hydrolase